MAGNVKEEHYKIVYDTGGVVKSESNEEVRDNGLRKPTPGAMYKEGGVIEPTGEKEQDLPAKPTPGAIYKEGGEIEEEEFKDPTGKTEELKDLNYYKSRMGRISKGRYRPRRHYSSDEMKMIDDMRSEIKRLEAGGAPSNLPEGWEFNEQEGKWGRPTDAEETSVIKTDSKWTKREIVQLLKDKQYGKIKDEGSDIDIEILKAYGEYDVKLDDKGKIVNQHDSKRYNTLLQTKRAMEMVDKHGTDQASKYGKDVARVVKYADDWDERVKERKEQKAVKEKEQKPTPVKKKKEEVDKKRMGGQIGYSYSKGQKQDYQKPTGDNYASSNRADNGETFSDNVTGMGD